MKRHRLLASPIEKCFYCKILQLTEMVKTLAVAIATAACAAAAPSASGILLFNQEDSAGLSSPRVDVDGIVKMDVDTGLRSTRAEGYIPSLPKLDFAHMAPAIEDYCLDSI